MKKHARIHTGGQPFARGTCHKLFTQSGNLSEFTLETNRMNVEYVIKRSQSRGLLTKHEGVHTGLKSYTCRTCNKTFTESENLRAQEKTHTGVNPLTAGTYYMRFFLC